MWAKICACHRVAIGWRSSNTHRTRWADGFAPGPGHFVVIDRQGRKLVSTEWASIGGLAWSPDGTEVWFTATKSSFASAIHAFSLAGRERLVAEMGETIYLHDISRDGRVLIAQGRFSCRSARQDGARRRRTRLHVAGRDHGASLLS